MGCSGRAHSSQVETMILRPWIGSLHKLFFGVTKCVTNTLYSACYMHIRREKILLTCTRRTTNCTSARMHTCTNMAYMQLAATRRTLLPSSNDSLAIALQSDTCSDYDECELGISSCGPNRTCANTHGSFLCPACNTGFETSGSRCLGESMRYACIICITYTCIYSYTHLCKEETQR